MKSRSIVYTIFFAQLLVIASAVAAYHAAPVTAPNIQHQDVLAYEGIVYLPFVISMEQQIAPAPQPILNGDFELGPVHWGEYSEQGWPIILRVDYLPDGLIPHSGSWAAWLGGDDNELAGIWQSVSVPHNNPLLSYWLWLASEDYCGYDIGGVGINFDVVVDAYWLCYENNTNGWIQRTLDLHDFAGQTVDLVFLVETDSSFNSNLFIDDVSFAGAVLTLEDGPAGGMDSRIEGAAKGAPLGKDQPASAPGSIAHFRLKLLRGELAADAQSGEK